MYLYQCPCGSKYVGESSLRLSQRVKSHINQGPISSIVEHQENCETFKSNFQSYCEMENIDKSVPSSLHCFMTEKFKILKKCRNLESRKWTEGWYIRLIKPNLNAKDEFVRKTHL